MAKETATATKAEPKKPPQPSVEELAIKADREAGNVMDCRFINIADPKADVSFRYGGERFHFEDGKDYKDIPVCVINHVNSRMFPDDHYEQDPASGQFKRVVKGYRPRCMLQPNVSKLTQANKGPAARTA